MSLRRSSRLAGEPPPEVDLRGFFARANDVEQTLREDERERTRRWSLGSADRFHSACEAEAAFRRLGEGRTRLNELVPFTFEERQRGEASVVERTASRPPSNTGSSARPTHSCISTDR